MEGCAGEKAEVEVFARAAEVELLVNGKKAARGKVKKCRSKFHIPYEDGEITAISYDKNGHEINSQTLVTANEQTILHIRPEQETVQPVNCCLFQCSTETFCGNWKPMEKHHLKFLLRMEHLKVWEVPAPMWKETMHRIPLILIMVKRWPWYAPEKLIW